MNIEDFLAWNEATKKIREEITHPDRQLDIVKDNEVWYPLVYIKVGRFEQRAFIAIRRASDIGDGMRFQEIRLSGGTPSNRREIRWVSHKDIFQVFRGATLEREYPATLGLMHHFSELVDMFLGYAEIDTRP